MFAAVDVVAAVTVNWPLVELVLTAADDGLQDDACAPTVYATAPLAWVYVVPEALNVPTLGFAAGTPRL
jgi:hypothetical protein